MEDKETDSITCCGDKCLEEGGNEPDHGVRLKLAFCMTCAIHVLVLAQGPSFRDSRGPC